MKTFFFYDLETSGLNPRFSRVMQFAGIRTDMDLNPIGEPINVLIKLSDDILPDPGAVMVTGITPQQTLADGLTEPEFCKLLIDDVFTADTITVGFNSVRFDDEFIRHTLWRNFYDPYEWAWSEGRSRWDMLDVVRMTRALRPQGLKWPIDENGKAVNKLELIAKENGLLHTKAHDALSDVEALIGVAKLIKQKHGKLFDYLLAMRDKKAVAKLVNLENPEPFVYASGRYDAQFEKTTVAFPIAPGAKPGSVLVYDLRYDPTPFLSASPTALASVIFADRQTRESEDFQRLPVKELSYNKCPAVAPMGVLDADSQERLQLSLETVQRHMKVLSANPAFGGAVREAFEMREPFEPSTDVEAQLVRPPHPWRHPRHNTGHSGGAPVAHISIALRGDAAMAEHPAAGTPCTYCTFPHLAKAVSQQKGCYETSKAKKLRNKAARPRSRLNISWGDAFCPELQLFE